MPDQKGRDLRSVSAEVPRFNRSDGGPRLGDDTCPHPSLGQFSLGWKHLTRIDQ